MGLGNGYGDRWMDLIQTFTFTLHVCTQTDMQAERDGNLWDGFVWDRLGWEWDRRLKSWLEVNELISPTGTTKGGDADA